MGMSYTKDGLRWVTNKAGKLIYYKNARLVYDVETQQQKLKGDVNPTTRFYIEQYWPNNSKQFKNPTLNKYEERWKKRFYQMYYTSSFPEEIAEVDRWLNTKRH
jgi:hypothetical protein